MMNALAVAKREVGSKLPISIPTAVALESIIDEHKKWPEELWINTRTLLRNLVSSVDTSIKDRLQIDDVLTVLTSEMEMIRSSVSDLSRGATKVIFYCCNYSNLELVLPFATMRPMNTELQKKAVDLEVGTMKELLKQKDTLGILEFKTEIDGKSANAYIVTHHAIDLLSESKFGTLKLLESHTGKLKPKSQWHTKLTNGKELTNIPFNKFSIQVFGDNNTALVQMDRKTREVVMKVAADNKWTPLTTMERIRYSIANMRDHFSKTILLKYCRS